MLILLNLTDHVPIPVSTTNRQKAALIAFNNKYANQRTKTGLGICVTKINKIHFYKIIDEHLLVQADFQAVFLKIYNDELCQGVLISQDETGLVVKNMYGHIFIPKKYLDREFEFLKVNYTQVCWYWKYEDQKLYFKNNEVVRFKAVVKGSRVFGRIDEQGLGPLTWWESPENICM